MLHDATKYTDAELLEAINTISRLMANDVMRLARPLSDEDKDNSQYWYDKRKPHLINCCQEFLRRNNQNGN